MNRFLVLFFTLLMLSSVSLAAKPRVVLLPVSVSEQDAEFESQFGAALQQGLQSRYEVYYGAEVEKQLEREYQKANCTPEGCAQNVAIAFNGELVGDASVKRVGSGFALSLVIRNVLTGKAVETRSQTCRDCDALQVIEQLKKLAAGTEAPMAQTSSLENRSATTLENSASARSQQDITAVLILDSQPSGAEIFLNGKPAGKTPYQGLNHLVGETLEIELREKHHANYQGRFTLEEEVNRPAPIVLAPGSGQLLVALSNYEEGAQVYIDNQLAGTAPLKTSVAAGNRSVSVQKGGKIGKIHTAEVLNGKLSRIVIDQQAGNSQVTTDVDAAHVVLFDTVPSGVALKINGQSAGVTPYQGLTYKKGEKLTIAINDGHYLPWQAELVVADEFTRVKPAVLQMGSGRLLVALDRYVAGAELVLDGKPAGPLPAKLTVPAGKHSVAVKTAEATSGALVIDLLNGDVEKKIFPLAENGKSFGEPVDSIDRVQSTAAIDAHVGKLVGSYTKIDAKGNKLPDSAFEWSCVLDNNTGLMWEAKTDDEGVQDKDWTYSWYNSNSKTNGGDSGKKDGGECKKNRCDTEGFVKAVNGSKLCSYKDWRMPTVEELKALLSCTYPNCKGEGAFINQRFFPNTQNNWYWSSSAYAAYNYYAWLVSFSDGYDGSNDKNDNFYVHLVRDAK